MINFKKISITSFKSIFKLTLDFSNLKSGLYLLEGQNNTVDFAKSNGAGKSTLLDALSYAIYGTTLGLYVKKEEYQNKSTKIPLKISLDFSDDSNDYAIERTLDSVKLLKNNEDISELTKTETEKKLLDIIGITKNEFFNFTYLAQSGSSFLNKTASEKFLAIREFIFGDDILQIKTKLDELLKEQKTRLTSLKEQKQNVQGKLSGLRSIVNVCEYNDIDEDIITNTEKYIKQLASLKEKQEKQQILIRDQLNIDSKLKRLKIDAENIKQQYKLAKDNICPTCKQHLLDDLVISKIKQDALNIKEIGQKYKSELADIEKAISELSNINNSEIIELSSKINQAKQYKKQKLQYDSVKKEIFDLNEMKKQLELSELTIEKEIAELTDIQKYFNNTFIQNLQNAFISEVENYLNLYCYEVFNSDFKLKLSGNSLDLFVGNKPYTFFSGGERQRIDLLFVFAIKVALYDFTDKCTNILLLDESLSGSDDIAYAGLIELISSLAESANLITILVSHKETIDFDNKIIVSRYDYKTKLDIINN